MKKKRQQGPDAPATEMPPADKRMVPPGSAADGSAADSSTAETPAANNPVTEATSASPAAAAPTAPASEPRRSLPAFGFASDLLKKKPLDTAAEAPPPAASPVPSSGTPASGTPAPASGVVREVVDRSHLHGEIAEQDLVEGVADLELERSLASHLLQDLPSENPNRIFDFADRLAARAEERKSTGPKPRLETCLTFSLGGETFAMPVEPVQQIVRISSITRVPHAPHPIRGVTNLRGRVIPVIDLRVRVGLPTTEIDRSARIIAVGSRGRVIGLLVDAVHQVMHIDLNQIQRPPDDVLTIQSDYIAGVYHHGESLILLLDVDRALIVRDSSAA